MATPHNRYVVRLYEYEGDKQPNITGWATFTRGDEFCTATLDHEYPDWQPAIDWHLTCRLGCFRVAAVSGKQLTIQKVEASHVVND